jgi:hypothetical protein
MDREATQRLRLDRRLIRRRGWISKEELGKELEALTDAAGKATTLGAAEGGARETARPAASTPEPPSE